MQEEWREEYMNEEVFDDRSGESGGDKNSFSSNP